MMCAQRGNWIWYGRRQMKNEKVGIARIVAAAGFSMEGLKAAARYEAAFRQELALCVVLIPLALWWGDNGVERALLIGSLLLVLMVELCNTSVEVVVDRIGDDYHELSGRAKDIGSAAVFVSLLNVVVVWLLVLLG